MTKIKNLQNWNKKSMLVLNKKFKDFMEVIYYVNLIKDEAEDMNHHPNIRISDYNKLEIEIYTHSEDKITDEDYELAERINKVLESANL